MRTERAWITNTRTQDFPGWRVFQCNIRTGRKHPRHDRPVQKPRHCRRGAAPEIVRETIVNVVWSALRRNNTGRADPADTPDGSARAETDAEAGRGEPDAASAGDVRDSYRHEGLSLKIKGILAFAALVCYAILGGFFAESERQKLLQLVDELERVHRAEEQLVQINMSMARTMLAVNLAFSADDPATMVQNTVTEIEATRTLVRPLESGHPRVLVLSHQMEALVKDQVESPGRGILAVTRSTLRELIGEIDSITDATRGQKMLLLDDYRVSYDRVTLRSLAFAVIGIIVFGALTALFFSRLTWDIRKLETRALDIVNGYRGAPIEVTRGDEIGSLMRAVNQMQQDLREHERHIERTRQEQFHREKMAAVGSLAAQLAHEINNPIAAISGIASSIHDVRRSYHCPNRDVVCQPELILEQTRRISAITRQIADFTRPQASKSELLDINQLIRSACSFVSYDRRFNGIALLTDLDAELPAVRAVGDHITQVLMNLLFNAADALEDSAPNCGNISVSTRSTTTQAIIEVCDNGKGMDASTLSHVFDEYFTTKPSGKGTGLGLALSRELIRDGGGTLSLQPAPGKGALARIVLPLRAAGKPAERGCATG